MNEDFWQKMEREALAAAIRSEALLKASLTGDPLQRANVLLAEGTAAHTRAFALAAALAPRAPQATDHDHIRLSEGGE